MKPWALLAAWLLAAAAGADELEVQRNALLAGGAEQGSGLVLEAPEWVEDGAFVPLTLRLQGARAPLRIALLRSAEADPRIAEITLHRPLDPLELSTRVRLPQSQAIEVLVRDAAERTWQLRREIRVAGSSCLTPPSDDPQADLGQTRAWLREKAGVLELVSLLRHPMESGRRLDAHGQTLPRRLLRQLDIRIGNEPLLSVQPFEGLAANPYWRVLLPENQGGLTLQWEDADGAFYRHALAGPEPR